MNVPKCAASAAPASSASHGDRDAARSSPRTSEIGSRSAAAAPVRQNAIASAGAAVAAMIGGAVDAHSTPTASSAVVRQAPVHLHGP